MSGASSAPGSSGRATAVDDPPVVAWKRSPVLRSVREPVRACTRRRRLGFAARHARTVIATRYVTALREGGSLPGLVEADDDGLYVVKFRGAGQGPRALVAEWLGGELGRALGLPVPDLVARRARPGARRRRAATRRLRTSSARAAVSISGSTSCPGR